MVLIKFGLNFDHLDFFPEIQRVSRWRKVISISHNHGHGKKPFNLFKKTPLAFAIASSQYSGSVVLSQYSVSGRQFFLCSKTSPKVMAYFRGVVSLM